MTSPEIGVLIPELNDPEDAALQAALTDMQASVDGHLQQAGLSIDDLSEAEQQLLADRVSRYMKFELDHSNDIWVGMPFMATGRGGILVASSDGEIIGAEPMDQNRTVTGILDEVASYPVPVLENMQAIGKGKEERVITRNRSYSAVVILKDSKFEVIDEDGGEVVYDLGGMRVLVPVIYGMQMSMAGKIDL